MSDEAPAAATAAAPASGDAPASPAPVEGSAAPAAEGDAPAPAAPLPGESKADTVRRLNGIAKRNAALRESKGALERERAAFAQERASFASERAGLEEFRALKADPSKLFDYAARNGVSVEAAVEAFNRAQDPAARADMERQRTKEAEDGRIKALEDKLAAQERLTTQQKQDAMVSEYLQVFEDRTAYAASRVLYSKQERLRIGDDIARAAQAKGLPFTMKDIADAVELHAQRDERYGDIKASSATASATTDGPADAPSGTQTAPTGTRAKATLTSRDAGERARVNENLEGLSLDERLRRSSLLKGSAGR
jgi:hypothetical protein